MSDLIVKNNITIIDAMKALNLTKEKCLLVVDDDGILLGTITDGDLRRSILKGNEFSTNIEKSFDKKPVVLKNNNYTPEEVNELLIKHKIDVLPVIDHQGRIENYITWLDVFGEQNTKEKKTITVPVVIMAGGRGTRLEPFTKVLPKPLVPIHEKPIIEHIIERFTDIGCSDFYLTVNYKSGILKAYFEELNPDYEVHFVEEQEPLGTAGSLRFLEGIFDVPFFVTNCDIIIKADYVNLYEFHQKNGYDVTLVASAKEYVIPYGTCELNGDGNLSNINEKPKYDFLINTGLYVVNQDVLGLIPKNKFYHITHLIEDAKNEGKKVGVYPIDDNSWIDVGQWGEYKKALEFL